MLRSSIPRGGWSWRTPWLLTSPRIFCLSLIVLLGLVGLLQGHPQCLDYRPPFQPLQHLEFCSDYESFGCCDQRKDHRIAARYWDIMEYFDLKGHELCGGYIKDILCQVGLSRSPREGEGASFGGWLPAPADRMLGWLVRVLGGGSLGAQPLRETHLWLPSPGALGPGPAH